MRTALVAILLLTLPAVVTACGDDRSAIPDPLDGLAVGPGAVHVEDRSAFADVFTRERTIVLRESGGHVVAGISDIALARNGWVAVSDAAEGNVKVFGGDGTFLRAIGRRGGGPGEFGDPSLLGWDAELRLHVLDRDLRRVTVFDPSGQLLGTAPVPESLSQVWDFDVLDRDRYLVAAYPADTANPRILHVLTAGPGPLRLVNSMLPIGGPRPEDQPGSPFWVYFRRMNVAVDANRAFVTNVASDSVWVVDLATGLAEAVRIDFRGRESPRIPDPPPRGRDFVEWYQHGVQRTLAPLRAGDGLAIPYAFGAQHQGGPQVVALFREGRGWTVIDDAPPLIHGAGPYFIALEDLFAYETTLGFYTLTGER